MAIPITLTPGTLPYDCYPEDPQDLNLDIVTRITASLGITFKGVLLQPNEPGADQRDLLWFKTGTTPERLYFWNTTVGLWTAAHPFPPGTLWLFDDDLTAIPTYDGGDTDPPGPASGPMWEEAVEYAARFPFVRGTLPGGTVVAAGDQGGNEEVELSVNNLPEHRHIVPLPDAQSYATIPSSTGGFEAESASGSATWIDFNSGAATTKGGYTQNEGEPTGTIQKVNVLPPYRALTLIRRSSRLYYKGS